MDLVEARRLLSEAAAAGHERASVEAAALEAIFAEADAAPDDAPVFPKDDGIPAPEVTAAEPSAVRDATEAVGALAGTAAGGRGEDEVTKL